MSASVTRAAILIGRDGRRGTSTALLRVTTIFAATLSLSLVLIGMVIAGGVLRGIEARDAARSPQVEASGGQLPIGYLLDTFSAPPLHIVLVQPENDIKQSPPAGLSQWPQPGEAFISPSVAGRYPVGSESPWGRVAGLIGPSGLVNPNEQYVYANPASYTINNENAVYGWGAAAGFNGDHRTNQSTGNFLTLIAITLLFPSVFFVFVATRLQSSRTRRSLEIFDGFGSDGRFRATVGVGGVMAPVAAASTMSGAAILFVMQLPDTYLPLTGVVLQHKDVSSVEIYLWASVIASAITVLVIAIWNVRRHRRRRTPTVSSEIKAGHGYVALVAPIAAISLSQLPRAPFPVPIISTLALVCVATFLLSMPFSSHWCWRPGPG